MECFILPLQQIYHMMYAIKNVNHNSDVIMNAMASQITGVSSACSVVCSDADQRKYQSSVLLAFVRGIHPWAVDSLMKGQ